MKAGVFYITIMVTISNLKKRLLAFQNSMVDISANAINNTKESLLELNKDQLYDGKTREGKDITPSYLDDPYFKSRESAKRYSDWKDTITPNPERTPGTPNYFIVGTFYDSIDLKAHKGGIDYSASFRGPQIEAKAGPEIYGLFTDRKLQYTQGVLKPEFYNLVKTELRL